MKRQKSCDETLTLGQKVADKCSNTIGSWRFIIIQSTLLAFWIILNVSLPNNKKWDNYPFILLNLMLSFQAAYTGPVLLMAANRQSEIDRKRAIENLEIDRTDHKVIIALEKHIDKHFHILNQRMNEIEKQKVEPKKDRWLF
jgi:uncharacterized membrane protein